jgi:hypothetical protein
LTGVLLVFLAINDKSRILAGRICRCIGGHEVLNGADWVALFAYQAMVLKRPKRRMRPRAARRRMVQASFDMRGEMRLRRVDMVESPWR